MSQNTHIKLEQKDCIFHILGIQNAPWMVSAKSNTHLRRKTQAPASHQWKPSTEEIRGQQPKETSHRCRKLHILNSNKKILSSILYVFRMHLNCFLRSPTTLWGGRHTRLTVTDENRYPDYASWGDNRYQSKQHQWGDSRSVDRLRYSHRLSYDLSML